MMSLVPFIRLSVLCIAMVAVVAGSVFQDVHSQVARFAAHDPGVRPGASGAGGMISGLTALQQQLFGNAKGQFEEVQSVQGTVPDTELGLGPRFNLDSCSGCHAHPYIGGTSPAVNPQVEVAKK